MSAGGALPGGRAEAPEGGSAGRKRGQEEAPSAARASEPAALRSSRLGTTPRAAEREVGGAGAGSTGAAPPLPRLREPGPGPRQQRLAVGRAVYTGGPAARPAVPAPRLQSRSEGTRRRGGTALRTSRRPGHNSSPRRPRPPARSQTPDSENSAPERARSRSPEPRAVRPRPPPSAAHLAQARRFRGPCLPVHARPRGLRDRPADSSLGSGFPPGDACGTSVPGGASSRGKRPAPRAEPRGAGQGRVRAGRPPTPLGSVVHERTGDSGECSSPRGLRGAAPFSRSRA